ncbi:hypothetical protein ACXIZN_25530 [Amycolatopsis sp. TRM77291]
MVDAEMASDSRQGPAEVVEVNGLVDLLRRETATAHRHTVATKNVTDRSPFDPKLSTQLIHRRASLIASDQLLDLSLAELPDTARPGALDPRWLRHVKAWKLLAEPF